MQEKIQTQAPQENLVTSRRTNFWKFSTIILFVILILVAGLSLRTKSEVDEMVQVINQVPTQEADEKLEGDDKQIAEYIQFEGFYSPYNRLGFNFKYPKGWHVLLEEHSVFDEDDESKDLSEVVYLAPKPLMKASTMDMSFWSIQMTDYSRYTDKSKIIDSFEGNWEKLEVPGQFDEITFYKKELKEGIGYGTYVYVDYSFENGDERLLLVKAEQCLKGEEVGGMENCYENLLAILASIKIKHE
ncbi:hypothetical protein KKE34_01490 [Patescibacteria group bacterium]|nr:hypothetical protein [Patescibacteria group bacterium]MBU1885262.1 hypothetical protein [Patescibacteria group bacterium]